MCCFINQWCTSTIWNEDFIRIVYVEFVSRLLSGTWQYSQEKESNAGAVNKNVKSFAIGYVAESDILAFIKNKFLSVLNS